MKRRIFALFLAFALCLGPAARGEEAKAVIFEDDLGRTVTVEEPKRVAALIGSFAHMWYLAGGLDSLAAAASDSWTGFDIPLGEEVINLGSTKKVSLETVIAAQPDFILASVNTDSDLALREPLEALGIPTAYFQVSTFEDYLRVMKILTDIIGCQEYYQKNVLGIQQQVDLSLIHISEPTRRS